jgi:adenylate cyclase
MKQACPVLSGKRNPVAEAENYCCFVKRSNWQTRFEVKIGNHTYEVDEFYGENKGLIIAEIELSLKVKILKPNWLEKKWRMTATTILI